jgi:membrane protein YdbS with pleckstrin-like domain
MSTNTRNKQTPKERGGCLSAFLLLVAIHGVLSAALIGYLRTERDLTSPWWVWAILFVFALADIVAMFGVWKWKKWGLWLYAISTGVGIAIGLVLTASQWIVFHDIIPLAILGYLVKDKQKYFS